MLRPTVLLADDDDVFAYAAQRAFEKAGYGFQGARSFYEALTILERSSAVDLLVTDVRFPPPQPHGFTLARMARWRRPDLPIIYVTGYPELADAEPGHERDLVLTKPVEIGSLVERVTTAIARSRRTSLG